MKFAQSVPKDGKWMLIEGSKWTGTLIYQNSENEERIKVPNVHYNQPASWRGEAMRFYEQQARDCADRLTRSMFESDRMKAPELLRKAEECAQAALSFERKAHEEELLLQERLAA